MARGEIPAEDSSATAGQDYASASGTVSFPAGATTRTVTVNVTGDDRDEPDETFLLNLTAGGTATLADGQGRATIRDDDATPTASDDSYVTQADKVLAVGAPGVLGGDTDADGGTLRAVGVSDPAHGLFSFNTNGSFRYFPDPGFTGTDSFTYKASDGANESNVATVTITVDGTRPTVLRATPTGTRVAPTANVVASFSEEMTRSTLTRGTVRLVKKGTRTPVAASVTVAANNRSVVLNPARALTRGAAYTATISTGATDLAGNPLAKARVWSFTVRR